MLVIIKSAPDTPEGKRGLALARDMGASIVLIQNGVYLQEGIQRFPGRTYALEEDRRMRGLKGGVPDKQKNITYDELVDLLAGGEQVFGAF
jgi:sulfur relay protein TusB/DsrH